MPKPNKPSRMKSSVLRPRSKVESIAHDKDDLRKPAFLKHHHPFELQNYQKPELRIDSSPCVHVPLSILLQGYRRGKISALHQKEDEWNFLLVKYYRP